MADRQKFFFYAPTWDYPPNGPIKLGNVLSSVGTPQRPLICMPPEDDNDIFSTLKTNAEYAQEKLVSGKFSILTKFLSTLGFGIDIGAQKGRSEKFSFDTIATTQFVPSPAYLQHCAEATSVRRYLEQTRYRKPIYIITGLKVVTGIQANTHRGRNVAGNVAIEVDGTVWSGGAVPVGGGPSMESSVSNTTGRRWEDAGDLVFAFRVSRVLVNKKSGLVRSEEEYQKGAMLDHKSQNALGVQLSTSEIRGTDPEVEGLVIEETLDDGDIVLYAIPIHDRQILRN
ncbi:hypothetical protein LQW54_007615 [Pestalotiopsis sp. IQ-011]